MLESTLISLGVLFLFVIIGGLIASPFRQPAVIGLLLVGALIGPNAANLLHDSEMMALMAELGAILLLFVIGLEFVIPKLIKIGFKAVMLGILKVGIVLFMTFQVCLLLGMDPLTAIVIGIILSLSSTVVIVKILESKNLYKREEMPLLIGILLIEDIFAVIVLTFLAGATQETSILALFDKLVIAMTVLTLAYLLLLKYAKHIIAWFLRHAGDDAVPYIALSICALMSALAHFMGLTPSIGAFLAGSVVASLPTAKVFEHALKPFTGMFSSLFFISVGTMVNFGVIREYVMLIVILVAVIIISRFVAVGMISYLFANFGKEQTIFSSLAMISIGEFSLLIAQAANPLVSGMDLVSLSAAIIFISAIIMSFVITSYLSVSTMLDYNSIKNIFNKPRSLSKYVKVLFDEVDTENSYSVKFKRLSMRVITLLFIIVFAIIGWRRVVLFAQPYSIWYTIAASIVCASILVLLALRTYKAAKEAKDTLVIILTNADSNRDLRKSDFILRSLFIAITLFFVALYSPFIIVATGISAWFNLIPLFLLAVSIIRMRRVFNIVHNFYVQKTGFPQYKRLNLKV